ncbi:SREBP regulating gene protein isoform X3 [Indicator indicator]|uniref:SREBP regulating gene protein isoform X3 n=1 Tax=Indicator indicator TaxID=1002788 RepID=UPI0023DE991E|nr:SREBP regulating gene protein isoform X3 [Indicator indicator]
MVPCGAVLWRRLLRKRWVLGVVFGLSLVYFLTSTFKQSVQHENTYRDPIAKYCYGEYPPELLPV